MTKAIIFDWIGVLSAGSKGGVFKDSKEILQRLKSKKYRLGLVSLAGYGNEKRVRDIEDSGLKPYFDSIVVDTTKKIEHYQRCLDELGVNPDEALIVDDRTVRGIKIGNELGCKTCWVMYEKYANETPNKETGEPTYRIKSTRDLLTIL
ncbi:HAD hydrolase-like protein [Candidatus Pacearchaeota archaeon]|nr:HAD hydrolase-like protein [Candidatus Pacearchaeota archaeon]